jgi:hypothetical protein
MLREESVGQAIGLSPEEFDEIVSEKRSETVPDDDVDKAYLFKPYEECSHCGGMPTLTTRWFTG